MEVQQKDKEISKLKAEGEVYLNHFTNGSERE